jgi:hypothetical protein
MPTDAALKAISVVVSDALQLLCISSARQTREFAYAKLREIPRIDSEAESEEGTGDTEQHQLPVFTARIAESLEEELRAATGYGASIFGAVGNALAFGAGAAGGRAHGAAAAGADAEFEAAWHQRTAQIRGTVEHKLMSLFPVALSGAARTAWVGGAGIRAQKFCRSLHKDEAKHVVRISWLF